MANIIFDCGCSFPCSTISEDIEINDYNKHDLPNGIKVDIYNINEDCNKTWSLICNGIVKGCFQIEKNLGKTWSKKIQPRSIEDLSALISLIRPGCLRAYSGDPPKSMTERYCDRKNGLEEVEHLHESLKDILHTTQSVMVYQEQAMLIASKIAGFTLEEADSLRKAVGKKKADLMAQLHDKFVDGCVNTGIVTKEIGEEIFGWIRESQRYAFNKSHGVSYATTSYWTAYLKAHFPLQFYTSYLHGSHNKQDTQQEIAEIVDDAKINGITINTPNLTHKKSQPYIKNKVIYFGLGDIKQLGGSSISKLMKKIEKVKEELGKEPQNWNWIEYLFVFSDEVSKTVNEALIHCGALDWLNTSRNKMLYQFQIYNELTKKEKEWIKENYQNYSCLLDIFVNCAKIKKEGGGCSNKNRAKVLANLVQLLGNPPHSLDDSPDFITNSERKYLGANINHSRVDGCEESYKASSSCSEAATDNVDKYFSLAVEITRVNKVKTKKGKNPGQNMAFLSVTDKTGTLEDVVIFPDDYIVYGDYLFDGNTVLIECMKSNDKNSTVIKKVKII